MINTNEQKNKDEFAATDEKKNLHLGVQFAVWHLLIFALSAYFAGLGGGWMGIYIWPPWLIIDFPWSLLYLVMFQNYVWKWLHEISSQSTMLTYILYPPFLVHGLIGTIWWGILPTIYLKYRRSKVQADRKHRKW